MKNTITILKNAGVLSLILFTLFTINSCKKSDDPNSLAGDTNIPLTQKDSVTSLYFTLNGISLPVTASVKVVGNDNGLVTYGASIDMSTYPDTVVSTFTTMLTQIVNYYHPKDVTWSLSPTKVLSVNIKVKITSEGMQNYFVDGKPWTIRYADAQGTNNSVTRDNGQVLTASVTEKTGVDDWPYSFWLIKTSKVEYDAPTDDPVLSKVTFRVNHKYGLVYVKAENKTGMTVEIDLFPWFLL